MDVQTQPRTATTAATPTTFDAVIVGAGFAGIYPLYRLRGLGFSARVYEAGTGVGGTWYWNRYPGARCDVESLDYQYSFSDDLQREWDWSERYSGQAEILEYMNHVTERFDLRRDMQFETRVTSATFDEQADRWQIETDRGDRVTARFCIMATGCLSAARVPEIPGLESFAGNTYHTGRWPHEPVDFTGQRVAVIGTGSSGIQSIPVIARQAAHLTVFQRTPNFSLPSNNGPLEAERAEEYKRNFRDIKERAFETQAGLLVEPNLVSALDVTPEEREQAFEARWGQGGFKLLSTYNDLAMKKESNDTVADFVRAKIREVVHDPEIAETLAPKDHPLGTKRICIDTDYYDTFNRDNVELVDLRKTPIEAITRGGITTSGREFAFDSIVFATGFDAMTGALLGIDIRGRDGLALRDKWEAGPRTYLGLNVAGFPNLLVVAGPGSPSVLANMIMAIEQHVDWISALLVHMRETGLVTIEAQTAAEDRWVDHVNKLASMTLYPLANSWYLGANVPGKPRVFMPYVGGLGKYGQRCKEIAAKGYEGFTLS